MDPAVARIPAPMQVKPPTGNATDGPPFTVVVLGSTTASQKRIRHDSTWGCPMDDQNESTNCTHLDQASSVVPRTAGCEECLLSGGRWVHLRLCLSCGHVGCCDSSPGQHATAHFRGSGHPLIQSLEPGEEWAWCNIDEVYIELRK